MLYSIHFLRFVASLAVVMSHSANVLDLKKTITVGDSGVDVFFIISGIVIALSTKDGSSPSEFFKKRFIRIFPLYWIALLAFVVFRYNEWGIFPNNSDIIHSLLLIPYFGEDKFPILFPAWTLSYELLFYIVFGAALFFFKERMSSICGLVFTAAAVSQIPVPGTLGATFDTQLCAEFVGGLAIAYYLKKRSNTNNALGIAYIIMSTVLFSVNYTGGVNRLFAWGVPSFMLVFGITQFEGTGFFRNRYVQILGSASYSIYLFHITSMIFMRERFASFLGIDLRQHTVWAAPALVVCAVCSGIAIHLIVEVKLLKISRKLLFRRAALSKLSTSS